TIVASGVSGTTLDGKQAGKFLVIMAHNSRLLAYKKANFQGKDSWMVDVFVPQGPESDGSNRTVSQEKLNQRQEPGATCEQSYPRDEEPEPATATNEPRAQQTSFTAAAPTVELTINDDNPDLGNFLVDFESGKLFSPPKD